MHVSISKIIARSKRLSPVKLASSPAKVDKQIPTSQAIVDEAVDTIHDISYVSDAELDITTSHGMCTSCDKPFRRHYSSFEESSHSEIDEDITRNTVW